MTWRLWYRRPGVLASRSDDGNVRVSVATVWPAAPLVCPVAEDATAPAGMNFLLSAQTLHSFSSPSTNIQSAYCLRWAGYLSGVVLNSGGRVSIPEIPEGLENTQASTLEKALTSQISDLVLAPPRIWPSANQSTKTETTPASQCGCEGPKS